MHVGLLLIKVKAKVRAISYWAAGRLIMARSFSYQEKQQITGVMQALAANMLVERDFQALDANISTLSDIIDSGYLQICPRSLAVQLIEQCAQVYPSLVRILTHLLIEVILSEPVVWL